jgi:anti-sigma28 factor (negative regulator of flagellin synthesis)
MKKTKTKKDLNVIDGNQLVGKVIEEKDPYLEQCVNTIKDLPDSHDISKVMKLKQKVDSGAYDFDEKLESVAGAILKEASEKSGVALNPFEN